MERDFMGLAVKQEAPEEPIDAAPLRSSAMHWPFSSKGSTVLSFSLGQDERPKTGFDSLTSTGLVSLTTTETFNSDRKPYTIAQQNAGHEKQGGVRYAVTTYPSKYVDAHSINRVVTNQMDLTISPTVSLGHHSVAGVPLTNPVTAMTSSPVVGTTELRNAPKVSGGPSQLTIFYNGSVCVYDNISPEKAQAIMLLAGNGPAMIPSVSPPPPVHTPVPRSSVFDAFVVSQPYGTTSYHSSPPVPVTAVSVSPYAARSGGSNDLAAAAKPTGVISSPSTIADPQKVGPSSLGSVSATFLSADTVPQSRRKSLARFLEKRKERVIMSGASSPYTYTDEKKSSDCGGSPSPSPSPSPRGLSAKALGSSPPVLAIN